MSVDRMSLQPRPSRSLRSCTRGAAAVNYVVIVGLVALTGGVAFAQFDDHVQEGVQEETAAAAKLMGSNDGPTGSLAAEVATASAQALVVQGSWALAQKAGTDGLAASRRKHRGRGSSQHGDAPRGGPSNTPDSTSSDPSRGDPTRGDPTRGDPTRGDPTRGDPTRGDPTRGDPTRGDPNRPSPGVSNERGPVAGTCRNGQCKPENGTSCFAAGTPVATPSGPRPIEQIAPGDLVLSRDERTGAFSTQRVSATFVTLDAALTDVHTVSSSGEHTSIRATPGHLFWTSSDGWVRADELVPGDALADTNAGEVRVVAIEPVQTAATAYNFEVESTHTYFVGATPVWVHNMTEGEASEQDAPEAPLRPWHQGAKDVVLLDENGNKLDLGDREAVAKYLQAHADAGHTLSVDAVEASVHRIVAAQLEQSGGETSKEELLVALTAQIAQARETLEDNGHSERIPPKIHFVWFGGPMTPEAEENLRKWGEKAKDSDYTVTLWTDPETLKKLNEKPPANQNPSSWKSLFAKSQADRLKASNIILRDDAPDQMSPEMRKEVFDPARKAKANHLASDVARYGILKENGGIYMDVDIAPGAIDLKKKPPAASTKDIPSLAPMVPTTKDWTRHVAAGKHPPNTPKDVIAQGAVANSYNEGGINNNLIMSQKGAEFWDDVEDKIRSTVEAKGPIHPADDKDAAYVSGPVPLVAHGDRKARETYGVGLEDKSDMGWAFGVTRHERQQKNWVNVDWVTDESDNFGFAPEAESQNRPCQ